MITPTQTLPITLFALESDCETGRYLPPCLFSKLKCKTLPFWSSKFLKTKNLKIREYSEKKDKKIVEKWFEDETSRLFLLSTTSLQNLNIDFISTDNKNIFGTITLKNDLPIGLLAILNIDPKNKKGEMRKLIGDLNYRGKGFAKEASKRWIDYCINSLGLRKIYINTIETNINNISLNRQLGFEIEGLFKKDIVLDGIEHDVLRMAYFKT